MPYCACIPKPLYTGSIIAYGSCCVLKVAGKKRGTTWFHCLKQVWVQLAAGVRSQAGSRMLGALFREGYTHSPSRVESQVAKAFPICLPHFTVLYISHGLRKHTSCCVSWFSNPLALVKGGISGYLYPFIVTPTVPAHFHSVSTEIPSVGQQHFDFESSNNSSKLLCILHRSTQMPFLLNLEILLTI